jgi:hypothetical protein
VLLEPARHLVRAEHGRGHVEAGVGLGLAGGQGLEQPLPQHPELQVVEELVHLVAVPLAEHEVLRADRHRHVLDQLGQLPVAQHAGQVRAQRLAGLALDLVDALDQRGQRAELADPLGRGLLADARHARQVVAGVAAQGGEVRILRRGQPVAGLDLLRGEPDQLGHAAARVEHGDVLADQLDRVAVAGGDEHVHVLLERLGGERRDDVVGLVALDPEPRDPQRVEHLLDEADLTAEVARRLRPAGLVFRVGLVAERLAGDVENATPMWVGCSVAQLG